MQRTSQTPRPFSAFYNVQNLVPGHGGPMDWENISDNYLGAKTIVKLNGAAAIGADSITVDALTNPLRAGQILRGPEVETVVVVIDGAEAIGQTSLGVEALTGPLPSGAVLDFGTGEERVKLTAPAAEGDVLITVEPLTIALEDGDTATYQGGENNIEVLEDVEAGATSVPVGNLQYALADNTELFFNQSNRSGANKRVAQCTIMTRHSVSGQLIPRAEAKNGETALGFLVSDADQNSRTDAKSGYGIVVGGTPIYENLLPDANSSGDIPSGWKTELAANGVIVQYLDYGDDTDDTI